MLPWGEEPDLGLPGECWLGSFCGNLWKPLEAPGGKGEVEGWWGTGSKSWSICWWLSCDCLRGEATVGTSILTPEGCVWGFPQGPDPCRPLLPALAECSL